MPTRSLATLFALLLAPAATAQEPCAVEPASEPFDFAAADTAAFFDGLMRADLGRFEPDELPPLLDRCARELAGREDPGADDSGALPGFDGTRETWLRVYRCAEVAREAAAGAAASDREALWRRYDDPETDRELREGIARGMLIARLREAAAEPGPVAASANAAVEGLLRAGVPERHAEYARRLASPETPRWFARAPAELRDAWRLVTSSRAAYRRATLVLAGDEPRSYGEDAAGFFAAVADHLRGRASALDTLRRAGRYEWGSWCGVGANAFAEPQDQLLMLLLLELGQAELARGALVELAFQETLTGRAGADGSDAPWHRLAARLGVDWESLALGSLLDGFVTSGLEVAVRGTEQGARRLLAALELPAPDEDAGRIGDDVTAISALAALVRPSGRCSVEESSSLDELREAPDLAHDVELDALAALAARTEDSMGLDLAGEAARQLHRLCRDESREAFEAMLHSRYAAVRARGAKALHALTGREPAIAASTPVPFRLAVDGAAWTSTVTVTLSGSERTRTATQTPDPLGRLALDRDLFVDPRALVAWIDVETPDIPEPTGGTWFRARFPVPHRLSEPTRLSVETQVLTLVLPSRKAGACGDGSCRVRLEAEAQLEWNDPVFSEEAHDAAPEHEAYRYFETIAAERALAVDVPLAVKVARGLSYRAVVERGAASWESLVVVPGGAPVTIVLRGDELRSLEERISEAVELP